MQNEYKRFRFVGWISSSYGGTSIFFSIIFAVIYFVERPALESTEPVIPPRTYVFVETWTIIRLKNTNPKRVIFACHVDKRASIVNA